MTTIRSGHIPFRCDSDMSGSSNHFLKRCVLGKVQGLINMAKVPLNLNIRQVIGRSIPGFVKFGNWVFVDGNLSVNTGTSVYKLVSGMTRSFQRNWTDGYV